VLDIFGTLGCADRARNVLGRNKIIQSLNAWNRK
jgi:hypothetical protein